MSRRHFTKGSCEGTRQLPSNKRLVQTLYVADVRCGARLGRRDKECRYCDAINPNFTGKA